MSRIECQKTFADLLRPSWKPDERVPTPCHDVDRLPMYGMYTWADAFTPRQLVALATFSHLVGEARNNVFSDSQTMICQQVTDDRPLVDGGTGPKGYADAVATYLGLGVDKITDYNCSLVTWIIQRDQAGHALTKQALPVVWDFCEVNPLTVQRGFPADR